MKYSLADLFRKSRTGSMSHDEIYWIEQQVRHVPYFQLHQTLLAQQEHVVPSGNPFIEKGLLYSTNRKSMVALMAQDQDIFIPSAENQISIQAETPNLHTSETVTAENTLPAESVNPTLQSTVPYPETPDFDTAEIPEFNLEDVQAALAEAAGLHAMETVDDADIHAALAEAAGLHAIETIIDADLQAAFAQAAELHEDTLVEDETFDSIAAATNEATNEATNVPDLQASLTDLSSVPESDAIMDESAIESTTNSEQTIALDYPTLQSNTPVSNSEDTAAEEEPEITVAIPKAKPAFQIHEKLNHKVQFRVQMFAWKAVLIRQEIEAYKPVISGLKSESEIHSADFVISNPRKSIELPETMESSFVPDFIFDTEQDAMNELADTANSSIALNAEAPPSPTLDLEHAQHEEAKVEITPQSTHDEETIAFRHNDLNIDVIIHPSTHAQYLRKPTQDLQIAPSPRKEYVKLSTEVTIEPVKKRANRQRTLELIDKFIENESDLAIKPLFPEGKTVDISKSSVADDSEIVSETLAQIYLKQGNKQKAIRTYQKLMLKFPEKSSYFESLLRNL